MCEDGQLEDADEGVGLSPVRDAEFVKFDNNDGDGWICSIDGSYAARKENNVYEQYELAPCSEASMGEQQVLRSVMSIDSVARFPKVIPDDSGTVFRTVSAGPLSRTDGAEARRAVLLPIPLDSTSKGQRSLEKRLKNRSAGVRSIREISPIRRVSSFDCLEKGSSSVQVYDPLRATSSQVSMSLENGFSNELMHQGTKLMNGLKAILREKIAQERQVLPPSYPSISRSKVVSRAGSSSSVSTARDQLSKGVHLLQEALTGLDLVGRARAGASSPIPKGDETIPDSFTMPDEIVPVDRAASGSRGTSGLEQARASSGASAHLHEIGSRRGERIPSTVRTLGSDGFEQLRVGSLSKEKEKSKKASVRHIKITHHVKHDLDFGARRCRAYSALFSVGDRPTFRPFEIKSANEGAGQPLDIESIPRLGKRDETRNAVFDGAEARYTIHGDCTNKSRHERKVGAVKRCRPIVVGRGLYSRGRIHVRPHAYHSVLRGAALETEGDDVRIDKSSNKPQCQDAATATDEPKNTATLEVQENPDDGEDDSDSNSDDFTRGDRPRRAASHKKVPFVGAGQEGVNTFSIVGNKQQVMKVTSTRFQEWLPLVRSIIYDSSCKDYARALQRDLARQKRLHLEHIRLLKADLKECKTASEREETLDDMFRQKQKWNNKHDRVLSSILSAIGTKLKVTFVSREISTLRTTCHVESRIDKAFASITTPLSEQIERGVVCSKVQQLRMIYQALLS